MNANTARHWRRAEREALAQLDAAKTSSALKQAAATLMRARRRLLELGEQADQGAT